MCQSSSVLRYVAESSQPYLPLLQKQWETLLPFRSHIVQRATAALRSRETADPKNLSETLLAIILLDNLPISDALSLLLSQRTKTIRDILAHPTEPTTPKVTLSPRARRRTLSRARGPAQEREAISAVLSDAVRCLLDTVDIADRVFATREKTGTKESLLEEMMRLVQVGEPAPVTQQAPVRRSSQQRRTSRMLSISLTMPQFNLSPDSPPISTPQVLQSLPSAQILLRHLPASITGFTPSPISWPPGKPPRPTFSARRHLPGWPTCSRFPTCGVSDPVSSRSCRAMFCDTVSARRWRTSGQRGSGMCGI
jgi:hypothetical protein